MKLILNVANQKFTVTVLLEYIDLFTTCIKIMLGPYYSVDIMFNALPSLKVNLNIRRKSTNHCDKIFPLLNVCVLATLVTRISVYSLYLETNLISNISPTFRPCLKVNTFMFYALFCSHIINQASFITCF